MLPQTGHGIVARKQAYMCGKLETLEATIFRANVYANCNCSRINMFWVSVYGVFVIGRAGINSVLINDHLVR